MSAGAITLQCPHCGGVFLTLQHGGIIEICPHCAVGAPRASFTASSAPVGQRVHANLPPAKCGAEPLAAAVAATAPTPAIESPLPTPPAFSTAPPPAPPSSFVQAAPTRSELLLRTPPDPQPVATQEPVSPAPAAAPHPRSQPEDTPDFLSASWPPPTATAGPTETWTGRERDESSPPVWPGLDREEDSDTTSPFPTGTIQRAADLELEHRAMPERRTAWTALMILLLLIASVTWFAFQGLDPVSIPRSDPHPPTTSIAPTRTTPTAIAPAVVRAPSEPAPEVKPAIPNATPDAVMALRVRAADERLAALTEKMVKGLENAITHSDRMQWIDATESQQAGVKRFFETRGGKFAPGQLEPSAGKVILLPSGEEMKLFRLTTATCREGALLQVRDDGGRAKMKWDLFEQSHEKTYDHFLSANDDGKGTARWFILLCQRGHSFELKGAPEKQWICFDAQGSLGAGGTGQIYVNKDSPVGRFLEPRTEWGKLYLVDLLIGRMDIDGRRLNVALDCAGSHAATGRR